MKKLLLVGLLLLSANTQAEDMTHQEFCISLAESTEAFYTIWRSGMTPKDIKPALTAQAQHMPVAREIISQVIDSTYLGYLHGMDAEWTKSTLIKACKEL